MPGQNRKAKAKAKTVLVVVPAETLAEVTRDFQQRLQEAPLYVPAAVLLQQEIAGFTNDSARDIYIEAMTHQHALLGAALSELRDNINRVESFVEVLKMSKLTTTKDLTLPSIIAAGAAATATI